MSILDNAKNAIENGEVQKARRLLYPLLKDKTHHTPRLFILAAKVAKDEAQRAKFEAYARRLQKQIQAPRSQKSVSLKRTTPSRFRACVNVGILATIALVALIGTSIALLLFTHNGATRPFPTSTMRRLPSMTLTKHPTFTKTLKPPGTRVAEGMPCIVRVLTDMTVLRAGPGISYHTAGVGYRADEFEAIFHTQDWEWLTVELEDGTHVWIKAQAVDFIYGGPSHLSQAKDIPPTYTPTSIGIPPTLTFTPLVGEYVEPVDVPDVPDTREPIMQPTTPRSTPQSESPSAQWNCSGDRYNCGDFSSCSSVMSYFRACPGDPSRLDGDNDGRPCESLCR